MKTAFFDSEAHTASSLFVVQRAEIVLTSHDPINKGIGHCTQNNFIYLCPRLQRSGRGLVRLRRLFWEQEIAGSNPAAPTK